MSKFDVLSSGLMAYGNQALICVLVIPFYFRSHSGPLRCFFLSLGRHEHLLKDKDHKNSRQKGLNFYPNRIRHDGGRSTGREKGSAGQHEG